MRAGFYSGPGEFGVVEVAEPTLVEPTDVIVEVEVAGMCGTDAHIASLPQRHPAAAGIVLGHEFVGRVAAAGTAVAGLAVGDRVVAAPNIWCGGCEPCRRGRRKHCARNQALGITVDGGFAPLVRAPARVLYPVPAALPADEAVFAEPLSCCANGLARLGPVVGEDVVVLGAGPIGQYFVRLLRLGGARSVVAVEPDERRRAMALASGADRAVAPDGLPDGIADVAVDAVGSLVVEGLRLVRGGGRVLLFGMDSTASCAVAPFDLVRNEKSVIGCFVDNDQVPRCLDLIPALRVHELVSHRLPLERIGEGIAAIESGEAIKVLVDPRP